MTTFISFSILFLYVKIFNQMRISGKNLKKTRTDSEVPFTMKTLTIVIFTNICCWLPLSLLGVFFFFFKFIYL